MDIETPDLVDAQGQSLRRQRHEDKTCPICRADEDRRVKSSGFGTPHPVCGQCGHDFIGEPWHER